MQIFLLIFIPAVVYCAISLLCKRLKNNHQKLKNEVVIITGASSGLGKALAFAFYRCGSRVVLCSRNVSKLETIKKELQQESCNTSDTPSCTVMELDITNSSSISKFAKEIILMFPNGIYALVNNAGMSYRGGISSTSVDIDRQVMDVNYFGHVALTKHFLPALKKTINQSSQVTSHVVYINSIQGKISIPHRSCYAASKFAATAFYDCLRSEVADSGINVCAVFPSYIKTNISLNAVTGDGTSYGKQDNNTLDGMNPDKVASKIVQGLLSDEQEIYVSDLKSMAGIWLRVLFPSIYFWYMKRRATKEKKKVV